MRMKAYKVVIIHDWLTGMRGGEKVVELLADLYLEATIYNVFCRNGFSNIGFIHLRPVQSISGGKNKFMIVLKDIWTDISAFIYTITFKKLNAGNLFIVAYKR